MLGSARLDESPSASRTSACLAEVPYLRGPRAVMSRQRGSRLLLGGLLGMLGACGTYDPSRTDAAAANVEDSPRGPSGTSDAAAADRTRESGERSEVMRPSTAQDAGTPSFDAPVVAGGSDVRVSVGSADAKGDPGDAPVAATADVASGEGADATRPSPILPVVLIEVRGVPIGETDKTAGVIRFITEHDGTLNAITQQSPSVVLPMAIELRGGSTSPKRSYSFELRDAAGKDRSAPLLGLPSESDFVLSACYADKTCLRNVLAYQLGRDLGHWAPRTRFVEVLIDGQYQGLYVLTERIKQQKNRVEIAKPAESSFLGDVTGGYIFKMEGPGEGRPGDQPSRDWISGPGQRVYSYHFPKFDKIADVQRAYLHGFVAGFETMMKGADWATKYASSIDVGAWVDHTLVLEAANNVHGYASSAYFHKQGAAQGGRLFAGPLWDFDGAFGNATVRDGMRTDTWSHAGNRFGTFATPYMPPGAISYVPFYWEKLWSDPAFRVFARCRWQQARATFLAAAALDGRFAAWRAELALAQPRDQAKWKTIGMKLPSNDFVGSTWDAEVTHLREWLDKRLAWMDGELAAIPGECPVLDADAGMNPAPSGDAGAPDAAGP